MPWISIRDENPKHNRILFKYDPEARKVQIASNGVKQTVELAEFDNYRVCGRCQLYKLPEEFAEGAKRPEWCNICQKFTA